MTNLRRESGITYLVVLMLIAMMGGVLAATGVIWKTAQQREKERELLFIGDQFRKAIMLYYERSPGLSKLYPKNLENLLKDDRYPSAQRYIRKIYIDPMTRTREWGLVPAPDGGIMGVYSLSDEETLKTANFSSSDQAFEGKAQYSEWQFVYQSPQIPSVSK